MAFYIKSERVQGVRPMRFREGGKLHYKVRIYIDADDLNDLRRVESVQYQLHETFKEPIRFSSDFNKHFEIIIWTYGFFTAKAKISKVDGTVDIVTGSVRWDTSKSASS